MCDLNTLAKLFLWGGYCFQHFHKPIPTTIPTTVPTTTQACSPCIDQVGILDLGSFEGLTTLCKSGSVEIPVNTLSFPEGTPACASSLLLVLTGECSKTEPPTISTLQVKLLYLETTGSATVQVEIKFSGFECATVAGNGCLDSNIPFLSLEASATEMCPFGSLEVIIKEVNCTQTCRELN